MKKTFLFIIITLFLTCWAFAQKNDQVIIDYRPPVIDYEIATVLSGDTIFFLQIYPHRDQIDSVISSGTFATKLSGSKWVTCSDDTNGNFYFYKYGKCRKSAWFKENNGKYFHADFECRVKYGEFHDKSRGIFRTYRIFLGICFAKIRYENFKTSRHKCQPCK